MLPKWFFKKPGGEIWLIDFLIQMFTALKVVLQVVDIRLVTYQLQWELRIHHIIFWIQQGWRGSSFQNEKAMIQITVVVVWWFWYIDGHKIADGVRDWGLDLIHQLFFRKSTTTWGESVQLAEAATMQATVMPQCLKRYWRCRPAGMQNGTTFDIIQWRTSLWESKISRRIQCEQTNPSDSKCSSANSGSWQDPNGQQDLAAEACVKLEAHQGCSISSLRCFVTCIVFLIVCIF